MPDRIDNLTAAQEAAIPAHMDRWVEIGTCTDEADWDMAVEAAKLIYEVVNVPFPSEVIRARNPVEAVRLGHHKARAIDGVGGKSYLSAPNYLAPVARYNFFVDVCGLNLKPEHEKARKAMDLFVRSCGGMYPHGDFVVIVDRMSRLSLQRRGDSYVLHSPDGPALGWGRGADGKYDPSAEDGYAICFWQGTRVPKEWIMSPPKTEEEKRSRASEILTTVDVEQRRAGCEIMGWGNILETLSMRVINEDPDPKFGRLVEVDLPDAPNERFLVARCGTGRTIALPVGPEPKTALEAGAMTYGVPVEIYKHMGVRT